MTIYDDPGFSEATLSENSSIQEEPNQEHQLNTNDEAASNGHAHEHHADHPSMEAPPEDITYPEANVENGVQAYGIGDLEDRIIIKDKLVIPRLAVSGSYIGVQGSWRLELRVDVDRAGALNKASFDFFHVGSTTTYWGSFSMNYPSITYTSTKATLVGYLTGTRSMWANKAKIVIPRNYIFYSPAAATITFMQYNLSGASYTCKFRSRYFRTVRLETDVEAGTSLFGSYHTGTFPNPGPSRDLTVVKAFQEAGINMAYTGHNNVINTSEAGSDNRWTESEMHASMVRHFSVFRNLPQWTVWLFAAKRAVINTLLGIMFDYQNKKPHRQGCAVFQDTLANYHSGNDYVRNQLYTYVHELGHAFNLLHSWDKSRPDSLSWMNYPWKYDQANGIGQFWNNFTFKFDQGELTHMRHGYYNNVVMGGNDWAVGAGHEAPHAHSEDFVSEVIENHTGLKLEIVPVKSAYTLGEPVVVEIKLRSRNRDERVVNAHIHPKYEQVRIGIMKPDGKVIDYEPVGHNCVAEKLETLDEEKHTLYTSAYIGYGSKGFYFDMPGFYKIKAAYKAEDGSVIQSEEIKIRIKSPLSKQDDQIADVYFTDDVGMLFYLLGSDSPSLKNGNAQLQEVASKYAKNPMSVYADFVLGTNEAMTFKTVDPETNGLQVRSRNVKEASTHLDKVFAKSSGSEGLDNISLNWAYRRMAEALIKEDDQKGAEQLLKKMENTFKAKKLNPVVMGTIKEQIKSTLKG
ncbi:hypothetical protein [Echinicola vietnamensis]|uniref:Uncharacterized protein n=1 Tax=Echinicola vietnamensis (strain DSM 17526 / LMG 23754 / KMM 6221) TaxID=926556 RepID=L0G119_ECHVK|nr:hypothetical protein [Echinicola vietnamensis]AGA79252.1 hypothetical protein Echvi_3014 [Echinicola vietnamensis DSM 17526]